MLILKHSIGVDRECCGNCIHLELASGEFS
jgi:hypothetical protein